MATIYVYDSEVTDLSAGTLATGDKFLIHDASASAKRVALASDIVTLATGTQTYTTPTFVAGAVYSANASFSFLIGTTLSARIGFYGKAGTSQPAAAAQGALTMTVENPATCTGVIGFSTTAAMQDLLSLVIQLRGAMVDNGLIKGGA